MTTTNPSPAARERAREIVEVIFPPDANPEAEWTTRLIDLFASELSAKDAEIERLTRWQDLCFELLSITRQWTAPGSITDLEAPRALRALLAERAEIRTTARADAVRECVAAARCGLNASSSGSADYISGFANGVLSGNQQTVTALESLLNKKDSNANS